MSSSTTPNSNSPQPKSIVGAGLGLRHQHMLEVIEQQPDVSWFEIISDNFIARHSRQGLGGIDRQRLMAVRDNYPISMHGAGMSLGSVDPLDMDYLDKIKQLAQQLECDFISEHAAFVSVDQKHYHDLLPLPYTEESLTHLSERVSRAQDCLGKRLILENSASYISYQHDTLTDAEFLTELCRRSGCRLLVDINNLYVNQHNHGWSAQAFIDTVPADTVGEIHLAGHSKRGILLIDSHSAPVAEPVWQLYRQALQRFGAVPTLIEWDSDIPAFSTLQQELQQAQNYLLQVSSI